MKNILEINNLKKVYGEDEVKTIALDCIKLKIREGEFVGIMGPSGSGKTTLLNIIATIEEASEGFVTIDGKNLCKVSKKNLAKFRREKLGFIFQDFNLLDTLTIKENIILPLTFLKEKRKIIETQVREISQKLGIYDILNKYPCEISGGQQQRAAACRAIISKPSIILADEPTGSLDSKNARNLLNILQEYNEEEKITIMMVTHDAISASYCSRVLFIKDGNIYRELLKTSRREEFYDEIVEAIYKMQIDNIETN